MPLTDNERAALTQQVMSDYSATRTLLPIAKAHVREVVNGIDNWVDANQASFNSAIPQPARGLLTTEQKSDLLTYVLYKRTRNGS